VIHQLIALHIAYDSDSTHCLHIA